MAFFHGILSLTKYFLCVVGPPLDIYYISFCVYSEGLYIVFELCVLFVVLCFVFVFCVFFVGGAPIGFCLLTLRGSTNKNKINK